MDRNWSYDAWSLLGDLIAGVRAESSVQRHDLGGDVWASGAVGDGWSARSDGVDLSAVNGAIGAVHRWFVGWHGRGGCSGRDLGLPVLGLRNWGSS